MPNSQDCSSDELQNLMKNRKPHIILGDFNAHNTIWGSTTTDRRGEVLESFMDNHNLILLNNGTGTRFNPITAEFSAIDLTMCDPTVEHLLSWKPLDDLYGSDHLPLEISIQRNIPYAQPQNSDRWNLTSADWKKYATFVETHITSVDIYLNIDDIIAQFTEILNQAGNESTKKIFWVGNSRRKDPWWNERCELSNRNRKHAYNRLKKCFTVENLVEYKKLRAKARYIMKESKTNSWRSYVSSINTNTSASEVWTKMRLLRGQCVAHEISYLMSDNNILTNRKDIVEKFADIYESNSSNNNYEREFLNYKISEELKPHIEENDEENPLNLKITYEELVETLRQTPDSSPGHDNLPYAFIRNLPNSGKLLLLDIYNRILSENVFPETWREATIIPILKPNKSKNDPKSYRPISLTCTMCKILEKIINKRLQWYIEKNDFLSSFQNGFRKKRSTLDNIVHLESLIHETFASKHMLLAVFLDIHRAFEMVWKHKIALTLRKWKITGNILNFVENFLKNRIFRVSFGGHKSTPRVQENGVPQGSVLSTTLFLIAVNDVMTCFKLPVKALIFADDLTFFSKGSDITLLTKLIQDGLDSLVSWSGSSGFQFSAEKTKCMIFTKKNISYPVLTMSGKRLQFTDSIEYLGIHMDRKLNWKKHIENIKKRCSKDLNLLRILGKHQWGADLNCLLRIYRCLIRSKIEYGILAHSTSRRSYFKTLETIQNKALRIVVGAFPTTPTISLRALVGEIPLEYRIQTASIVYAAKILSIQNHCNKSIVKSTRFSSIYASNLNITPPFHERLNRHLAKITYEIPNIMHAGLHFAPWTRINPQIELQLTEYNKKGVHLSTIRRIFAGYLDKYREYFFVYTDASKNEANNHIGLSVVTPTIVNMYRIDKSSIFTGELTAIYEALVYISEDNTSAKKYCVCTDSLSAIQSLQRIYDNNDIVNKINNLRQQIENAGSRIIFIYTPSHTGIDGNCQADVAAKWASKNVNKWLQIHTIEDIKIYTSYKVECLWKTDWLQTNTFLKQIKPNPIQVMTLPSNRLHQVKISRLRLGCTRFTHSYLLKKENAPMCTECHQSMNVNHILLNCAKYQLQRERAGLTTTLQQVLGQESEKLESTIGFLKNIDLLKLI
ncbi:hypothetical protein WA026_023813 [Henosepilachna vigintioctopunctata]|uniref:Uncharacterized protein n=1 Tax=Henosepilachna vigintioctopunctata TaxID=420089 RepID=A0AAW1UKA2_9CUCU